MDDLLANSILIPVLREFSTNVSKFTLDVISRWVKSGRNSENVQKVTVGNTDARIVRDGIAHLTQGSRSGMAINRETIEAALSLSSISQLAKTRALALFQTISVVDLLKEIVMQLNKIDPEYEDLIAIVRVLRIVGSELVVDNEIPVKARDTISGYLETFAVREVDLMELETRRRLGEPLEIRRLAILRDKLHQVAHNFTQDASMLLTK